MTACTQLGAVALESFVRLGTQHANARFFGETMLRIMNESEVDDESPLPARSARRPARRVQSQAVKRCSRIVRRCFTQLSPDADGARLYTRGGGVSGFSLPG